MLITESELASLMQISKPAIQRLRRLHPDKLPHLKLGKRYLYDLHEVEGSLKEMRDKPD